MALIITILVVLTIVGIDVLLIVLKKVKQMYQKLQTKKPLRTAIPFLSVGAIYLAMSLANRG